MTDSVYCPETDTTYASLDAWRTAEAGVLFKTAEITGAVAATDFNIRDDEFIGGALITAATGQEFNPANINGTHARALGMIRFVSRNTAIYHNISNIEVKSLDLEFATSNDTPNAWAYNCYINPDSGSNIDGIAEFVNSTTGYIEKCIVNGGDTGNNFDGIYSARSSGNQLGVKNCLVVDCGRYGVLRTVISNTLSIGSRLGDYLGEVSMEYSASGDSTADGVGAITGATYADLVDYAGGDWRTALSSSLATGGEGGSFIGVELQDDEPAGGELDLKSSIANNLTSKVTLNKASSLSALSSLVENKTNNIELLALKQMDLSSSIAKNISRNIELSRSSSLSVKGSIAGNYHQSIEIGGSSSISFGGVISKNYSQSIDQIKIAGISFNGSVAKNLSKKINLDSSSSILLNSSVSKNLTGGFELKRIAKLNLNASQAKNLSFSIGFKSRMNLSFNGSASKNLSGSVRFIVGNVPDISPYDIKAFSKTNKIIAYSATASISAKSKTTVYSCTITK